VKKKKRTIIPTTAPTTTSTTATTTKAQQKIWGISQNAHATPCSCMREREERRKERHAVQCRTEENEKEGRGKK
jgi:hypothetical protein